MSDCIFCKIVQGVVPAEIVYRDEEVVAFKDVQPQAPEHFLVVPREHISDLNGLAGSPELTGKLMTAAIELAGRLGLDRSGFRLVTNCGADGGQTVDHVHIHLLGGRIMTWPPG